ncbi:ABC transporter ATP-binding protein [Pseudomonas mangiferae]|uniref:ABC transporter ATP-binding protein n=1 Tax=Pseudomonas mangiferae TaxID=2593654 RepID=A0A553GX77_9PSED|nr:ABC transporter ATP-binding protein [Pseudomonas mangiferae]TRX74091.1 ABC transporter ATP-binding protein [Pseudomonas mangiferae]
MSSDIAISLQGVSKTYHLFDSPAQRLMHLLFGLRRGQQAAFHAVADVSFEVRRGETLGIIGRNGAGKSTLLQMICGTLTPSAGQIQVNGRIAALLELGAGFSPDFTGRENVYMSAAIHGLGRAEIDARLDDILAFAEIGEFIDQPVKTYSSGMFVRLAFAVIAHLDADILVIDEALAVGDVYFTQKCIRFLRQFAERNTLLFVSHDTNSVVNLCQRALWLEKGRTRLFGEARVVSDAYLGSFYENRLGADEPEPRADEAVESEKEEVRNEFGLGGGRIERCELLGEDGQPLRLLDRAQPVRLKVRCVARDSIEAPILGFFVKDRLSQALCGENTLKWLPGWQRMAAGETCELAFDFWLPHLATGEYTVSVALGAGTQQQHVQHHWIHDVLAFKAQADVSLTGLFELERFACRLAEPAAE